MGTDLIADIVLLATLIASVVTVGRMLRNQRTELKGDMGTLRTELRGDIKELRTELRRVEQRLGDRIDAVRDELVETRVAMADRVARLEGRVFGVPLPGTGTDSA